MVVVLIVVVMVVLMVTNLMTLMIMGDVDYDDALNHEDSIKVSQFITSIK